MPARVEGGLHDATQALGDELLFPCEALPALRPLEVRGSDTAGVGEDVRYDDDAAALDDRVLQCGRHRQLALDLPQLGRIEGIGHLEPVDGAAPCDVVGEREGVKAGRVVHAPVGVGHGHDPHTG